MYYSVKTLLENGKSISEIARTFNIDRKTVRKIKKNNGRRNYTTFYRKEKHS